MTNHIFGIILVCLGLLFISTVISPKIIIMIFGFYLLGIGIKLLNNNNYPRY